MRAIHYTEFARKEFLRGTRFKNPDSAIRAGIRSEYDWSDFLVYYKSWFRRMFGKQSAYLDDKGVLHGRPCEQTADVVDGSELARVS